MIEGKFQYTLCVLSRFVITYIEYIPIPPHKSKFFFLRFQKFSEYINEPNLISEMEMSLANVVIISINQTLSSSRSFIY